MARWNLKLAGLIGGLGILLTAGIAAAQAAPAAGGGGAAAGGGGGGDKGYGYEFSDDPLNAGGFGPNDGTLPRPSRPGAHDPHPPAHLVRAGNAEVGRESVAVTRVAFDGARFRFGSPP